MAQVVHRLKSWYAYGSGLGSFSKIKVIFNHVGSSFNLFKYHPWGCLNNQIFSNLGFCAACWAHCVPWMPTSVNLLFSSPNCCSGLAGGKHYHKIIILVSLYPCPRKLEGGTLDSPCPSVCRRHGFRSISQVCFGISISNFICMLMVAIDRSLLIFSDVTFKMAAWRPYWIFWFPDSNFTLALNINFKLQLHNTYVYG